MIIILKKCSSRSPAHFSRGGHPGLVKVDVRLDTNSLFNTMVEQARLVVFKAVSQATNVGTPKGTVEPGAPDAPKPMETEKPSESRPDTRALASFSSALSLSAKAAEDSPRLAKARHSALKLNSILQGNAPGNVGDVQPHSQPQPTNKFRKNRSVQWDTALDVKKMNNFPPAKRQRQVQSNSRLRSFKSFGRPHGSDGRREAKNATFGDFGRSPSGPVWGKNGKLLNHPTPGGLASSTLSTIAMESSDQIQSNQNATFDVPPKTMKRTATALESWLVQNATGRR